MEIADSKITHTWK